MGLDVSLMAIRGGGFMTSFRVECLKQVYKELLSLLLLGVLEVLLINLTLKFVSFMFIKILLVLLGISNLSITLAYFLSMVVFILEPNFALNSQIIKSIYDFEVKYRNAKSASNL